MKLLAWLSLLIAAVSCSNAGSDLGIAPTATRLVPVLALVDRDASGTATDPDTVYGGVRVSLIPEAGGGAIQTITIGTSGLGAFEEVPVGRYSVTVDAASVGDSLVANPIDPVSVTVSADTIPTVLVLLSFGTASIREVRALPAGQRVLVRGLVLAGVQTYRDTTSYVSDTSSQIRLTRVSLKGGLTGNSPGDSVVVVGTVSSRAGQPTLDLAVLTRVGTRPAPVPFLVSTAQAANASGGTLDAALAQITSVVITDTATVAPDFRVVGSDGSGPVAVILDVFGGFNRQIFAPGRTMTVRGILVPTGTGEWELKPRGVGDVSVF